MRAVYDLPWRSGDILLGAMTHGPQRTRLLPPSMPTPAGARDEEAAQSRLAGLCAEAFDVQRCKLGVQPAGGAPG